MTDYVQFVPRMMELHQSGQFLIDRLCKTYNMSLDLCLQDTKQGKVIKGCLLVAYFFFFFFFF